MNPDTPTPREEMEAKLTALLLGELQVDEAFVLGRTIERDAELAKLYSRLEQAIGLVRQAAARPAEQTAAETASLKLSDSRREKLLVHFKTVTPKAFAEPRRPAFSWLVPVAAAAAFVALLGAMLLPSLSRAKSKAQSVSIINNLRQIDAAKTQWALENSRPGNAEPTMNELKPYLGRQPASIAGEKYVIGKVGEQAAADLRDASPKLSFRTWSLAPGSARETDQRIRLLADGSRVSAGGRSVVNFSPAALPSFESAQVQHQPLPTTPTVELVGTAGQSRSGGIVLPASADFDNKRDLFTVTVPATSSPPLTKGFIGDPTWVGVLERAPQGGGRGGSGGGGGIGGGGGGGGGAAGGIAAAAQEPPASSAAPGQAVPADQGNASVALNTASRPEISTFRPRYGIGSGAGGGALPQEQRSAGRTDNLSSGVPIDPTTGLPATSRSVQAVDPTTGLPVMVQSSPVDSTTRLRIGQEIVTPIPSNQRAVPVESEALREQYRLAFSKGEVADKAIGPKDVVDGYSQGKPLITNATAAYPAGSYDGGAAFRGYSSLQTLGDELQSKVKSAEAGEKGALRLMPPAAPNSIGNKLTPSEVAATKAEQSAANESVSKQVAQEVYLGKALTQEEPPKRAYYADSREAGRAQLAEAPNARTLDLAAFTNVARSETLALNSEPTATRRAPAATKAEQKAVDESGKELSIAAGKATGFSPAAPVSRALRDAEAALIRGKVEAEKKLQPAQATEIDEPVKPRQAAAPAPEPQPEFQVRENAFSTFSMNVSDVSFKLAAASLEKGQVPDAASIRSEEFINAFDYRDPEAAMGAPVAFAWERARYPFAHNRDLLRFSIKTAAAGRQPGRPLNIVLLLDNSGSMERADRVRIIHEALRVLAGQLQPQDKLSVVTFARTARLWVDGVTGDQAGKVAEELSGLTPQGGTNLEQAMNLAYQTAARHYLPNGINRVVLLTDGAANLGDVEPESLKQKVEAQRKQGIALDCFGIGWEGFNDDLLEVLSRHGDGRYGFINTQEEAATEFAGQLAGALHVAAADVKVQVEFNPNRVTAYRQIGYAKHQLTKEQFRDNTVDAAEIGAAESGNALYVIETNPAGQGQVATVRVRYKVPSTGDYREQEWPVPYTGSAISLEQASPAIRLAASASAFSEWLAGSPYAAEVTPDRLLGYLRGVPEVYGADARPKKLEWMIRQAKSLGGK